MFISDQFFTIFGHFWPFLTIFWKKKSKPIFWPKIHFNLFKSILSKKNFKNFFQNFHFFGHFWSFFDCFWPFSNFLGWKMKKKVLLPIGQYYFEFLSHHLFRFKIRFEIFWIDLKKKSKIFLENFHFLAIFVKKWLSPRKQIFNGKFFSKPTFRFKIRFEIFWIDSTNNFFDFFLVSFHFLAIFVKKW